MIYFVTDGEYVKIGFSDDNDGVSQRVSALQTGNARRLSLIATIPGGIEEESILHSVFRDLRVRGEWFDLSKRKNTIGTDNDYYQGCECEECGREFGTIQALNAHTRFCSRERHDGRLPDVVIMGDA